MKIRSTVTIDDRLKSLFDASRNIHGKTFSEVTEEAIRKLLDEYVPGQYLENLIDEKNEELVELQKARAYKKALEQHIRNEQTSKQGDDKEDSMDILRNQKFPKIAKTVRTNLKNGFAPNWDGISAQLMFDSPQKCKKWVMTKMVQDGYISEGTQ